MMDAKIQSWISDAAEYEFRKDYGIGVAGRDGFIQRQHDFYVELLTKMYHILETVADGDYRSKKGLLLDIAKGMSVYSHLSTKDDFSNVNKDLNTLYISSIYYLCGYEAIASLLAKCIKVDELDSKSSLSIYFIVTGGKCADEELESFIRTGDNSILANMISRLIEKDKTNSYDSLDDFFDSFIFAHVLHCFSQKNLWVDLKQYAPQIDWKEYINYSFSQNILSFLVSQRDALEKGILSFERSFSLKMPTSAGKSYLTETLIYHELKSNENAKILYLCPLRALAYELRTKFNKIAKHLKFVVHACYGGGQAIENEGNITDCQLLISTPEYIMGLEDAIDHFLESFTLIVCDEGQLLDDQTRGVPYEMLLARLRKKDNKRFLFLSALVPNISEINQWLGGKREQVGDSTYRPCDIRFAYSNTSKGYNLQLLSKDYSLVDFTIKDFISNDASRTFTKECQKRAAFALQSLRAGSVMIFVTNKGDRTGTLAYSRAVKDLCQNTHLPKPFQTCSNADKLTKLIEYFAYQVGEDHDIVEFVRLGFMYHNANLPQDFRELVERAYGEKVLPLVVCTNTLAEGVNLPVKTLVIGGLKFFNGETQVPISNKTLKNILGRVGRAGKEEYGLVILPHKDSDSLKKVLTVLRNQDEENVRGILYELVKAINATGKDISEQVLNELLEAFNLTSGLDMMIMRSAEGEILDNIDIQQVISSSLAYFLGDDTDKRIIENIFNTRYNYLKRNIGTNFPALKKTGIAMNDFDYMENTFIKTASFIVDQNIEDTKWLSHYFEYLTTLPSYKPIGLKGVDDIPFETYMNWTFGIQYRQIAESLKTKVDIVIAQVLHFINNVAPCMMTIAKYVEYKFETEPTKLYQIVDFAKLGVNKQLHLWLAELHYSDRILNWTIYKYLIDRQITFHSKGDVDNYIIANRDAIKQYIDSCDIPVICKNKF